MNRVSQQRPGQDAGKFFFFSLLGMFSFSLFLTFSTGFHITVANPLLAAVFAGVISLFELAKMYITE